MSRPYDYSRIKKTAKKLIDRFGGMVTIAATSTVPNPQKWKPPTETTQSVDLKAVSTNYEEKFIDGTVIKRGDKKFLIAADGVELPPDMTGWIMDADQVKWNVVKVKILVPGSEKILYTVQVRQ